jgi:hypothetical protein
MTREERLTNLLNEMLERKRQRETRTVTSIRDLPPEVLRNADWVVKKPEPEKKPEEDKK